MSNEPKEGIKAIATDRIYGKATINPVSNIIKANPYHEQERKHQETQHDFSSFLEKELEKKKEKPSKKQEKLRLMGGLNQYDRHAREFCFFLSNETDYKA